LGFWPPPPNPQSPIPNPQSPFIIYSFKYLNKKKIKIKYKKYKINKINNLKYIKTFKRFIKMSKLSKTEIADLDKWIEQLKQCQPLEECQVKILCEKVK